MTRGRHKSPWQLGGRTRSLLALALYLTTWSLLMAIVLPPREPLQAEPPNRTTPEDLVFRTTTSLVRTGWQGDGPAPTVLEVQSIDWSGAIIRDPETGEELPSTQCLTYEVDCPTTTYPLEVSETSTTSTTRPTASSTSTTTTTVVHTVTTTRPTTTTTTKPKPNPKPKPTTTTTSTTTTTTTTTTLPPTTTTLPQETTTTMGGPPDNPGPP